MIERDFWLFSWFSSVNHLFRHKVATRQSITLKISTFDLSFWSRACVICLSHRCLRRRAFFQSIFHFASCCFHREIQSRLSSLRSRSKMLFNRIIDDICQQIRFHSSHYVFISECWLVHITFIRFTSQIKYRLTHFDLSFRDFLMNNCEIATFALSKKKEKLFNLRSKLMISSFFFSNSWSFVLDLTKMFEFLIVYDQKSTRLNRAREFFFFFVLRLSILTIKRN
jgi:hypothetical protein